MAIVAESTSTASPGGGGTTIEITAPSGVASGDVLVALVSCAALSAVTISGPAGWVEVEQEANGNVTAALFYKVAGGSEPGSYEFSFSDSASARQGGIARYSGVDNGSPMDATSTEDTDSSDTAIGLSVTTATDGAFVLMGARSAANVTFTAPSGMSDRFATARSELFDVEQASAGASGDKSAGLSSSTAWVAFLAALKPAGGASPVTVEASPGMVSVSGPAATVAATTTISAGVGVVAVSGPAASVQIGSAVTVEASAGVVSVSGPAATIVAPIVVSAGAGVVQLVGNQAAVVATTTISAGVGVADISGLTASIVATTTISAAVGVVQLVGNQATVVSGAVSVQASAGVVLVSGPRATIVTARYVYDLAVQDAAVYTIVVADVGVYAVELGDEAIYTVELSDASRA